MIRRFVVLLATLVVTAAACTTTVDVASERVAPAQPTPDQPAPTLPPEPAATAVEAPATPPPTPSPSATPEPSVTPLPTVTPEPTPTPQPPGPCSAAPLALPNPDRPRYNATLDIDPVSRTVDGSMQVEFTPDQSIDDIFFRLWPNGPRPAAGGVQISVSSVTLDGESVEPIIDDPTIAQVRLASTLGAGETVTLAMDFAAVVPVELNSRLSGRDDYLRLGTILPLLPWEPGRGWALDPATSLFAEAVSSPVADYTVQVAVPDGFNVLASCLLYTSPSPRDATLSRMPSSA